MIEKSQKNQGGILTKLLISRLLIALMYQTCYKSNGKLLYSFLMDRYEKNNISIFLMKILEMNKKIAEKSRGYTYKITHISLINCPRVLHLIAK